MKYDMEPIEKLMDWSIKELDKITVKPKTMKKELKKETNPFGDIRYYIYVNGFCESSSKTYEEAKEIYDKVKEPIIEILEQHESEYKSAF